MLIAYLVLRILTEELLRSLVVDDPHDKRLEEILKELAVKSKTSKLCVDILVKGALIIVMYISCYGKSYDSILFCRRSC